MLQAAVDFFKRNTKAKACHVVLDAVFEQLATATIYKKAYRANTITSYTRKEYEAYTALLKKEQ